MSKLKRNMSFPNRFLINDNHSTFIIAEAEVNHNGSVNIAKQMILKAKDIGCDAVKFQTYITENFVRKNSQDYKEFKDYELNEQDFLELKKFSEEVGILIFSTAVEAKSVGIIERVGFPIIKIGSSNISNVPLLREVAKLFRPVLLSTGASTIDEIRKAVEMLKHGGVREIGLLHCTLQYPTEPEDVNLNMFLTLKAEFPDYPVGYSDHTMGISASLAAVALGARIIEKHFTLDRKMEGQDHFISADPEVMSKMVRLVREVERELGLSEKVPIAKEQSRLSRMRRHIVADHNLKKHQALTEDDLTCMRIEDGRGIEPWYWDEVLGRRLKREIMRGKPIAWEDLLNE